ncbi:MAG: orotate phosphoribosyltransferase [Alphaproteobacteria bacterium]|nr:orotate phosphoribosyltransferase [Alphaproteobacteria bacterium]
MTHTMDAAARSLLAARVVKACRLTGTFTLRSGRTATEYFDKYQITSNPTLLRDVVEAMLPLIPNGTEVLAGLELGAVPLATLLSQRSGLPAAYVRKKAKEYGTARLAEGTPVAGKRVLVVEDIVTSGGQVVLSTKDLRGLGANVATALAVIDREEGGRDALTAAGIDLIALFSRRDLTS